jgi:hypothetical protein
MTTRLVQELTYDAPVDEVAAMLADPAFREAVCVAQRATKQSVSIRGTQPVDGAGDPMKVTIDMWQPTSGIPGFAKKLVGNETNIVQTESWSSATHGDITVTIPGKPGEMVGTAVLVEEDGRTVETVTLDIHVRIPLVAGKIEDLIKKLLSSALRAENRTGVTWLAERS